MSALEDLLVLGRGFYNVLPLLNEPLPPCNKQTINKIKTDKNTTTELTKVHKVISAGGTFAS